MQATGGKLQKVGQTPGINPGTHSKEEWSSQSFQ